MSDELAATLQEVLDESTSGFSFDEAGTHDPKGVPDRWHLFRVIG